MSQAEPSSDSDSNTSSSWIFLDDCPLDNQPSKKDDYTNYDRELVQELTLPPSNSANIEQETDSDGISIISDSDDMRENFTYEEPPIIQELNDIPGQILTQEKVIKKKDDFNFNKYLIISSIVIAVMTPVILKAIGSSQSHNEEADTSINSDYVSYPSKNLLEIKQKYDNKGESDEHRLNCEEHFNSLSHLSKAKGNEKLDRKFDKSGGTRSESDLQSVLQPHIDSPREILDNSESYNWRKDVSKKSNSQKNYKKSKEQISFAINHKLEKTKRGKKKKDYDLKTNNFAKKKSKIERNELTKRQKKKKSKKGKEKLKNGSDNFDKQIKKLKKIIDEKDTHIKDLVRLLKVKDKHLKMLEYKVLKYLNALTKGTKSNNEMLEDLNDIKSTFKMVNATSGEWYSKLYEGRSKIRNQHHASDWLFERADFRNKKRNMKNNWYWSWMMDREQMRLKKGFWQFTY